MVQTLKHVYCELMCLSGLNGVMVTHLKIRLAKMYNNCALKQYLQVFPIECIIVKQNIYDGVDRMPAKQNSS